jgi:predicted metalloendopeptidase
MKKTATGSFFCDSCTLGLTVTQAQTVQTVKEPGINVNYMDKTVKPANDFFRYVNGTWLDNTEIPSDRTRWGR